MEATVTSRTNLSIMELRFSDLLLIIWIYLLNNMMDIVGWVTFSTTKLFAVQGANKHY